MSPTSHTVFEKIERILDNKPLSTEIQHPENTPFQLTTQLKHLEALPAYFPFEEEQRIEILCQELRFNFEAGIALKRTQNDDWNPFLFFSSGQVHKMNSSPSIRLPPNTPLTVKKSKSFPLLQKLELNHLDPENKMNMFLLSPTHEFSLLLLSGLGEPWLPSYMENIRDLVNRNLAP